MRFAIRDSRTAAPPIDLRLGRWQATLAGIEPASVRLLLTSPPYDDARTYEGTNERVDFGELAAFARRVLCPGGVLAMVLDGPVVNGRQSVTPYRVICEWAALEGWRLLQVLAYGRQGAPGQYRGRFRRDHEPLIVLVRDGAPHVSEKGRLVERALRNPPSNWGSRRTRDGSMRRGRTSTDPEALKRRHRGSIWWYGANGHGHDPSSSTGHPATFSERFALDAVTVWSNPGDLVCDPFAGSGTVARACKLLRRAFIGAEIVPRYHAQALRRIGAMAQQRLETTACESTASAGLRVADRRIG
jgi:site-specific DNA-methyltransferase (adenine-specific)